MQCCTELTPPTAVTHSLSIPFLSSNSNNLILARTSLLQIYTFKTITTDADPVRDSVHGVDTNTIKLVFIAEYPLSGTIISLGRVKTLTSKSGGECLLIAFKDAKLCLMEWDPERHGLSTVSIHYYEREDLQGSPWAVDSSQSYNYLTVDPSSRCAALKFGGRNLAILPFRQAGDDLVMDEYDSDVDGKPPEPPTPSKLTNGTLPSVQTPYSASFVLPLSVLDPSLMLPVHLQFLHEYREPTFGILSSPSAPSLSLLHERRDMLTYSVFTLDLEQRASTTLLSISGLPYDLYKLIPLPIPVGGALLVGGNELIHIDQAGKTNGVGVNSFAKQCSSFAMADQSDLELRLENCTIEQLNINNGEMLIILNTGHLVMISFKLDGRSVSGISVQRVTEDHGGFQVLAGASCVSVFGEDTIFVGSENTESVVLGWDRQTAQLTRRRSELQAELNEDISDDDMDDYEDDLYSSSTQGQALPSMNRSQAGDYTFRIHDSLLNLAPLQDLTFGRPTAATEGDTSAALIPEVDLVTANGYIRGGGVSVMNRDLNPLVQKRLLLPKVQGLWSFCVQNTKPKTQPSQGAIKTSNETLKQFDEYLIASRSLDNSGEESLIYTWTASGFEELEDTEFDPAAGGTIEVGMLAKHTRAVQVLGSEIRTYDSHLGIAQIYPMFEEYEGVPPRIVGASFADPYLLLTLSDSTINILEADDRGDIDEVESGDELKANKWITSSLYTDHQGVFLPNDDSNTLLFLINSAGALKIYKLPDLAAPIYSAETLTFLPPTLSAEYVVRRSTARESVIEVLVADLGDSVEKSPYLILRSANGSLTIYKPFHYSSAASGEISSSLRFNKISNPTILEVDEPSNQEQQRRNSPLRAINNIGGYSTVFLPGESPSFILKSASTMPKVVRLRGKGVEGLTGFHVSTCERAWIYVDEEGTVRIAQLPQNTDFTATGWPTRKVLLGKDVHGLSYHSEKDSYVVATSEKVDFTLPEDDDFHHQWRKEDISMKPQVHQTSINILSPQTWSTVDSYLLEPTDLVLSLQTLNLEVSEHTHVRKDLIAVGTASPRGDDLAARGSIYVFEIIPCVPEPGRPETDKKLKLIAREEVKGAVTALSAMSAQGFLIAAQGQKCMVRGLKEDGSLLPVAFLDMMCYVSVVKELRGTGLCVMGDASKGVWFAGFSEDPYRLTLFSKSAPNLEVITADFLPDGKHLYIVALDADSNMHVFQFDPEHPKSLSGHRLLHRTTFHTGHYPSSITLLPSCPSSTPTPPSDEMAIDFIAPPPSPPSTQSLLVSTSSGSLLLVRPLAEQAYRRLSALQTQLTNSLDHTCGLNARSHRAVGPIGGLDSVGGRGVVDGTLLKRWNELGSWKRREIAGRVGIEGEEGVRRDLAFLVEGLGFL